MRAVAGEVDYAEIPTGERSALLNRPQRRPSAGNPVRRIDHLNLLAQDVTLNKEFLRDRLGFGFAHVVLDDGSEVGAWMSVSPLVHELALTRDQTAAGDRLHHVCFWYGVPQHVSDAAELFRENGIPIEAGPGSTASPSRSSCTRASRAGTASSCMATRAT